LKWGTISILIEMALFTGIAALSESPQAVRDPQIEQALAEARQVPENSPRRYGVYSSKRSRRAVL
jgi:hypothetical protein